MRTTIVPLCLTALCLAPMQQDALADIVSGTVVDSATENPIGGAIVSLQATTSRTTTEMDGTFSLDIPAEAGLVIVAARKGYFNASIFVDAPATGQEISLHAVPQDDDPTYVFTPPVDCQTCHPFHVNEWTDSPMALGGLDTWVADLYNGDGTTGGMGGFVYTRDSVFKDSNPASECASCHQPEKWIADPFSPLADPQDPPTPAVLHGISCEVCHKIADVDMAQIHTPGIFPGVVTITRPAGPAYNAVMYGALGDADINLTFLMRSSYQPQLTAEVCAACHQDAADPNEDHSYDGVVSEATYSEWLASPYADIDSPLYADCVDCHMPSLGRTRASELPGAIERDPNTLRSHMMEGTTPEYLDNAVEMTMDAIINGGILEVEVQIANTLTGHHVPTGTTIRNIVLLVEAWADGDDPLTDPLPSTGAQVIHDLGGVGDPAQGYYAGLPGKFFAKVNHDANGEGPTLFTEATGILFDNRIPALATDVTNYTFAVPELAGSLHVRARLIYRRAFRSLVDAKQWTEDGHGNPLEDIAAPHYGHLMEIAEQTVSTGLPILPAPPHDAKKNRYISFDPNNGATPVAFQVTLPDARTCWVGQPVELSDTNGIDPQWVADCVASADGSNQMRDWSSYIDQGTGNPVVHVRGCVIFPDQTYDVRAMPSVGTFSAPLTIGTVPLPTIAGSWCDCVGSFDPVEGKWSEPDGNTSFLDIAAGIQAFQQQETAPVSWIDMVGSGPEANYIISFADISAIVSGFQNNPYWDSIQGFTGIADCLIP